MPDFGSRLRDEREALGLGQTALAERCGVTARSQRNYETGERSPDAEYLAALAEIGGDVLFVLTGKRDPRVTSALTAEEQTLLAYFKHASREAKRAALGALLGAPLAAQLGGMSNSGAGAVQVGSAGGKVVIKKGG